MFLSPGGGRLVYHTELQPERLGSCSENFVDYRINRFGFPKNVDNIDRNINVSQFGITFLPQYRLGPRIHRDHVVPLAQQKLHNGMAVAHWIIRRTDHGDGLGPPEKIPYGIIVSERHPSLSVSVCPIEILRRPQAGGTYK
jgi:hypothetical protein